MHFPLQVLSRTKRSHKPERGREKGQSPARSSDSTMASSQQEAHYGPPTEYEVVWHSCTIPPESVRQMRQSQLIIGPIDAACAFQSAAFASQRG